MATAVLYLLCGVFVLAAGEDCVFDKNADFPKISPLIMDSGLKFVLPAKENDSVLIRIPTGTALTLACPGSSIKGQDTKESVSATCVGGNVLSVDGKEKKLSDLGCKKKPKSTILSRLDFCGADAAGVLASVGFQFGEDEFHEVISVCYEGNNETTLYSKHTIHGANIDAKDVDPKRPSFKTSKGFFNVSMKTCYEKKNQRQLLQDLLQDNSLAETYFFPKKQYYFAKGHLAPDADFVTEAEQDATYYYINAVPQWQAFNNGNWKYLEMATRTLAEYLGTDLEIYTGAWGVLELDNVKAKPVEVYLGLTVQERVVPAPAVTWKVIHDKKNSRAAAVVGVNNPHITSPPTPLCSDLCSSLPWIDFDVHDLGHGYTYCCTVEDLRASIPHVPDLGDVSLLDVSLGSSGGGC
ncbi:deoxyribonuclease I [Penaeus vannamei]|uniref:Deoxyribonuclease I n=1 Tax=Penaeus vannamei TaxID=6689 RepID=A0A3R7PEK4_PENVA|nr:uncharacterized protein LOC113829747 [Penaeus vannamei]ROT83819.1 deoxyribonuclease I [Penaeus vannamei]